MATSIRGRGGRRTAPHASKQLVDRLEPRQMLAVTTLKDFGGLPRELTAVGSRIYFALDSAADGKLTYVDLVDYHIKSGKQRSIVKPDGTRFGQTQFYLHTSDGKLVIRETTLLPLPPNANGDPTLILSDQPPRGPDRLWTVSPGETIAHPVSRIDSYDAPAVSPVSLPQTTVPQTKKYRLTDVASVSPLGADRSVFTAKLDGKRSRLFTMKLDGTDVRQLDVPTRKAFTAFHDVMEIAPGKLLASYWSSDNALRLVETNGRADGTVACVMPKEDATNEWTRFAGLLTARDGTALLRIGGGVYRYVSPTEVPTIVKLANADVGASLGGYNPSLSSFLGSAESRQTQFSRAVRVIWRGDVALIGWAGSEEFQVPDPEAAGGYVPPSGSSDSTTTIIGGGGLPGGSSPFVVAYNFARGTAEQLPIRSLRAEVPTGGPPLVYTGLFPDYGGLSLVGPGTGLPGFYTTDGTAAGTKYAFESWRAATTSVSGRLIFQPSGSSAVLKAYTPDFTGTVTGRIVTRGQGTLAGNVGTGGLKVFIDRDGNGTRSRSEPVAITNGFGYFAIPDQPAGAATVRLFDYAGLYSVEGGLARATTIAAGESGAVQFFIRETTPSATISGNVSATKFGTQAIVPATGLRLFLDLDADDVADANEPRAVTDAAGAFAFTGLFGGTYRVRAVPGQGPQFTLPADGGATTVRVSPKGVASGQRIEGIVYNQSQKVYAELFADLDRDESYGTLEWPQYVAGATLFVDLDRDGAVDANEPRSTLPPMPDIDPPDASPVYLGKLMPGTYRVRAALPTNSGFAVIGSGAEVVIRGKAVTARLAVTPPDAVASGRAYVDVDGSGTYTPGDQVVQGMRAWADLNGNGTLNYWEPTSYLFEDGIYRLENLPHGTISIHLAPYDLEASLQSRTVNTSAGDVSNGDFVVRERHKLRIGLFVDRNGNSRRDAGEELANRVVYVPDAYGMHAARTRSNGVALVEGIVAASPIAVQADYDTMLAAVDLDAASRSVQWIAVPA